MEGVNEECEPDTGTGENSPIIGHVEEKKGKAKTKLPTFAGKYKDKSKLKTTRNIKSPKNISEYGE